MIVCWYRFLPVKPFWRIKCWQMTGYETASPLYGSHSASAMEGAGKLVEDECDEAMLGKGLVHRLPAAAIIEGFAD